MQTSQALKDLENSAKAQAEELENSMIEIHKQSAEKIGENLRSLLLKEIDLIKKDMSKELQKTISLHHKDRSVIISLSVAISVILGIAIGWVVHAMILKEEVAWTIPKQWRYSQPTADKTQREYYISIPKDKEIIENESRKFILMKME